MEILNCPFCGSKCSIKSTTLGDSLREYYRVQCEQKYHCLDEHQKTEKEAVESWNQRFSPKKDKNKQMTITESEEAKQYVAITEVTPIQIQPEVLTIEQVEKVFEAFKNYGNFPQEIKTDILPNYQIIKIAQETFDFISNSAIIEQKRFGEKTYRLNNQAFKIYEWEDYINQFGEPNFGEK